MKTLAPQLVLILAVFALAAAASADKKGSSDYPGIGRYEGSEITRYSVKNYDETTFATGPVNKKTASGNAVKVEGKITRIIYRVPDGSSPLEVYRNFANRVREAGYQTVFAGNPDNLDYYTFMYKHSVEKLDVSIGRKLWYLFAKRSDAASVTYLSLLVGAHSGGDGTRAQLIVSETKQMENRMIDADKMKSSIAENGQVALYGIYFDTDSARLEDSSKPTLDEIGKLLRKNSKMRIIVVGHTDDRGGYDHNLNLSKKRAAAVVEALKKDYGIAASRLRSAGVGYLAPAATNTTEDGRALNRRVVLVRDE